MKLTAMNAIHRSLGAAMVNAGGWEIPGYYTSPVEEHQKVRNCVGLTDFSSMGEIDIKGPDATALVERLVVNRVANMPVGRVIYTTMLDQDGTILDDVTVYRLAENHFWIVTSTVGHDRSFEWVAEHAAGTAAYLTDVSPAISLICVQGPESRGLLSELCSLDLTELKYFWASPGKVAGIPCIVSRTGFTGELGYELYVPSQWAVELWQSLMEAGESRGAAPVGITACASLLRLEKAYMAGAELTGASPLELPIAWTVKLDKHFIGKDALLRLQHQGLSRKLVGLEIIGGVPKQGAQINCAGVAVGRITSAAFCPTVDKNLGLGFVSPGVAVIGQLFQVSAPEGADLTAKILPIPFYDPQGLRLRT